MYTTVVMVMMPSHTEFWKRSRLVSVTLYLSLLLRWHSGCALHTRQL